MWFYRTYGNLDAFEQIRTLQSPWNKPGGTFTELLFNRGFVWMRWRETWGEFGWRRIHLDSSFLWLIAFPIVAGLVGLGIYALLATVRHYSQSDGADRLVSNHPDRTQAIGVGVLLLSGRYRLSCRHPVRHPVLTRRKPAISSDRECIRYFSCCGLRTLIPRSIRPIGSGLVVFDWSS
ncbi:MAG: hypothetical protein R2848_16945 [Thermomicrobiales bacterium]